MPDLAPDSFPALETLYIAGLAVQVVHVVRHITSQRISSLHLDLPETPPSLEYCAFPCSLSSFELTLNYYGSKSALKVGYLSALYPCHLLRILRVTTAGVALSVSDMQVEAMARSWSNLRSFHLETRICGSCPPETTFASLQALGKHCPFLEQLTMVVDASGSFEGSFNHPPGVSHLRLRHLNLSYSLCGPIDSTVSFINHTFPRLESFQACEWSTSLSRSGSNNGASHASASHPGWKWGGSYSAWIPSLEARTAHPLTHDMSSRIPWRRSASSSHRWN